MIGDDQTITLYAVSFTAYGKPQQRGSKSPSHVYRRDGTLVTDKNGHPIINTKDSNEKSKAWMDTVRSAALESLPEEWEPLSCPLRLVAMFYFLRPQSHYGTGRNTGKLKPTAPACHAQSPDLAKLVRCLEDALIGTVISDDKIICGYNVDRRWTANAERVEVSLMHVEY